MKKVFYVFIVIIIFLVIFSKTITVFFLEKSLTKSLKREVEITSFAFSPLNLDATIKMENFPDGIDVHVAYDGGLSLSPRSIGRFIITSQSLGGHVRIVYEHYIYNIQVDSVNFKKVAQILNDKKEIVRAGVVNGDIIYYKKKREGSTNLKVTKVVLYLPDIDQTIASVNDAISFNLVNLFSQHLSKTQTKDAFTYIDHFQFDIDYKKKKIIVKDVALRTDKYRVSLVSKLDKKGEIDYFYIHLLDKKGCAVVTQELSENVKTPKRHTTTAVQQVVQASPKSFFHMGQQMMKYGSTYAGKQTGMSKQAEQMTSYVLNESDAMFEKTSNMVINTDCEVIYSGKVKHPTKHSNVSQGIQKDLKNVSTLYREKLLL